MSIAIATGLATAVSISAMSAPISGSHAGPVIWQGTMLLLFLPLLVALNLAWNRIPLFEDTPKRKQQARYWRRFMYALVGLYIVIGAALMILLMILGI
jgi:hypothetical protein